MRSFTQIALKIAIILNLVMILPGIIGLFWAVPFIMKPVGVLGTAGILAGIYNAIDLYRNPYNKQGWFRNLVISLFAIIFYIVSAIVYEIDYVNKPFFLVFIWPLAMTAASGYVLQNFYSYEKAKR